MRYYYLGGSVNTALMFSGIFMKFYLCHTSNNVIIGKTQGTTGMVLFSLMVLSTYSYCPNVTDPLPFCIVFYHAFILNISYSDICNLIATLPTQEIIRLSKKKLTQSIKVMHNLQFKSSQFLI